MKEFKNLNLSEKIDIDLDNATILETNIFIALCKGLIQKDDVSKFERNYVIKNDSVRFVNGLGLETTIVPNYFEFESASLLFAENNVVVVFDVIKKEFKAAQMMVDSNKGMIVENTEYDWASTKSESFVKAGLFTTIKLLKARFLEKNKKY